MRVLFQTRANRRIQQNVPRHGQKSFESYIANRRIFKQATKQDVIANQGQVQRRGGLRAN